LEGGQFFQTSWETPIFASQRVPGFDVGLKTFGKITDRTSLAVLNAADFGNRNDLVAVARHSFADRTGVAVAVADRSTPDLHNQGTFVGLDHSVGPVNMYVQHMSTRDTERGAGHRYVGGAFYQKDGWELGTSYVNVSPDFLPRLGFAPERGFKGFNFSGGLRRQHSGGPFMETGYSLNGQMLEKYDGSGPYRRQVNGTTRVVLRNNTFVSLSGMVRDFRDFNDRLMTVRLDHPYTDPYRGWSLRYQFGNVAGQDYQLIEPSFRLRPMHNLQFALSHQILRHKTRATQTVMSANYDLNAFDSIGGRMVQQGKDTNFYVAFKRAGNTGNEYFLILGDPNAPRFRPSLVLKAVMPFNLRL
jgi:hypothetical protein